MRALIIEDQFIVATLIETQLRDFGYELFEVVDSEDGAVAAAREYPDLIPLTIGWPTVRALRRFARYAPIDRSQSCSSSEVVRSQGGYPGRDHS